MLTLGIEQHQKFDKTLSTIVVFVIAIHCLFLIYAVITNDAMVPLKPITERLIVKTVNLQPQSRITTAEIPAATVISESISNPNSIPVSIPNPDPIIAVAVQEAPKPVEAIPEPKPEPVKEAPKPIEVAPEPIKETPKPAPVPIPEETTPLPTPPPPPPPAIKPTSTACPKPKPKSTPTSKPKPKEIPKKLEKKPEPKKTPPKQPPKKPQQTSKKSKSVPTSAPKPKKEAPPKTDKKSTQSTQPTPPPTPKIDPKAEAAKAKRRELIAQAQKSIAKNEQSRGTLASNKEIVGASAGTAVPGKIGELHAESLANDDERFTSGETSYRDQLECLLQLHLRFPEFGSVKIKLTLERSGKFLKVSIVNARSTANRAYIEKMIPTLKYPSFGNNFAGQDQYTFVLDLSNQM